jgi:hypothetical protein
LANFLATHTPKKKKKKNPSVIDTKAFLGGKKNYPQLPCYYFGFLLFLNCHIWTTGSSVSAKYSTIPKLFYFPCVAVL